MTGEPRRGRGPRPERGRASWPRRANVRRRGQVCGRGWNWAQVATAVGVLTAGAGLVFTAISTYIGVLVAQDQLEQSRQDSEDHARLQSSKIVMRTVLDATGAGTVVANRSTLPVTSVYGYLHRPKRDGVTGVGFPDPPPCSRFTVDHDTSDGVAVLAFTDSNGRGWTRTPDGELEQGIESCE